MTRELRIYGLPEELLRERLGDLTERADMAVTLSYNEGHGTVAVTADGDLLEETVAEIALRLGGYVYSCEGESLATVVVQLLADHNLTVSTAESCTGGMVAAALTDVPGASRVFGTGVVSYSNRCKERLLTVSDATITVMGAVSAETAGQMARGVRQTGDASVGVAVTGEAGPTPSEDLPVGTVFVALSDKKRTWVEELHLDGADRATIRRQATDSVLWLLWRYLSAYPAVMAGGENNYVAQQRTIPRTEGAGQPRLLSKLLPWKGDSRRRLIIKSVAWLLAVAVLLSALIGGYQYFIQPHRNQELQESLGDLYWEGAIDLTADPSEIDTYPLGMLPVFRGLYDMNPDVGGWLHIPGTEIDYPVMQYADGYYETHSFLKEYSIYGQPYFGSPSTRFISMVYGQNTGDGQMFSELLNYRRVAYLQEHSVIECNTIYANKKWQIFAVVVLDDNNPEEFALPTEEFETEEDYVAYVTRVQERSLFLSDVVFTGQENLLVLSTEAQEEYGFSGARLAVFARLIQGDVPGLTYRVNNLAKMPSAMYRNTTTRPTTTTDAQEGASSEEESTTAVSGATTETTVPTTETMDADATTNGSGLKTESTVASGAPTTTDTEDTMQTVESTTGTTQKTNSTTGSTTGTTQKTDGSGSTTGSTTQNPTGDAPTTGNPTGADPSMTTGTETPVVSTEPTATESGFGTTNTATDASDSGATTESTSATMSTELSTNNTTDTTAVPTHPTASTKVAEDD